MITQHKIAIVGAGLVGGSAALFACYSIPGVEIVLIDVDPVRAEGQVLDLAHAAAIWRSADFRAGDYSDAKNADIVVITAGAGVKPGQTRLDLCANQRAPYPRHCRPDLAACTGCHLSRCDQPMRRSCLRGSPASRIAA